MTLQRVARATLEVPAADVDLETWLFGLSDEEYQRCARGHHGAGVYHDEQGRGMVNVESIGGNLIVQHYRPVRADRARTELYSVASTVFLLHLVPVAAAVRWTLALAPKTASSSELTCTVDVELRPVLGVLARLMAGGMFLGRHVTEETAGFAD